MLLESKLTALRITQYFHWTQFFHGSHSQIRANLFAQTPFFRDGLALLRFARGTGDPAHCGLRKLLYRPCESTPIASGCSKSPSSSSQSWRALYQWHGSASHPSVRWPQTHARRRHVPWRCADCAAPGMRTTADCVCLSARAFSI